MNMEITGNYEAPLPLLSLNHVSILCRSVLDSMRFYEEVLGFGLIKRPSSFKFNGAWLYSYGFGIHLLGNPNYDAFDTSMDEPRPINPKDNHISLLCTNVGLVKMRFEEMGMKYVITLVEDEGIKVEHILLSPPLTNCCMEHLGERLEDDDEQ